LKDTVSIGQVVPCAMQLPVVLPFASWPTQQVFVFRLQVPEPHVMTVGEFGDASGVETCPASLPLLLPEPEPEPDAVPEPLPLPLSSSWVASSPKFGGELWLPHAVAAIVPESAAQMKKARDDATDPERIESSQREDDSPKR
jgi:hypothetical protein